LVRFRVIIDAEQYEYIRDILLPRGVYSESRDLFKFWETNDNYLGKSETVPDRDVVATEH